jgi:hypothetical protein
VAGGIPLSWGCTPADLRRAYPADRMVAEPALRMTRAVHVDAAPAVAWRWLCQMEVAPYSYDWIDNPGPLPALSGLLRAVARAPRRVVVSRRDSVPPPSSALQGTPRDAARDGLEYRHWPGRRSPRELTPGVGDPSVGQRVQVFRVTDVDPGHQWSGYTTPRAFGRTAVTYAVEPEGRGSRLVCRIVTSQRGPVAWAWSRLLAWGDLVMMRKQLLTFKELAERNRSGPPDVPSA